MCACKGTIIERMQTHKNEQADTEEHGPTWKQTDTETQRLRDRQKDRGTNRLTDKHTHTHKP